MVASSDLNELFNDALRFAQHMLLIEGEFIPFGVSMDLDGNIAQVAGDLGTERPRSAQMVEFLQATFQEAARLGEIRAAGVCLDMYVVPPGRSETMRDAVCVRLAHISGEALEVFVPYTQDRNGACQMEPAYAAEAGPFTLVEP